MKNNGAEEIELSYREKIEELRNQYQHELSSHAFVSLYLWRKQMKLTLHLEDEMFAVKCGWKGENAWFFPCGRKDAILKFFKKHKEQNFSICYARNEDIEFIKTHFPNEFFFFLDEDSHEYIYEREGHRTLIGKKYGNLRTQLHKIEREHSLRTEPLNSKTLLDAKEIVRNWSGKNHWEGNFEAGNGEVEEEALNRLEELGIFGIVVYMDEKPYAVAAGYPLSEHLMICF